MRRGGNRSTRRKTSRSKDENQQQTGSTTYDAKSGNRLRATLVGSECSHHCTIPAPRSLVFLFCFVFLQIFPVAIADDLNRDMLYVKTGELQTLETLRRYNCNGLHIIVDFWVILYAHVISRIQ